MVTTTPVRAAGPAAVTPVRDATRATAPRLRSLDGLRFAAAAGVVLYHFTARWHAGWGEDPGERFPVLGQVTSYFALAPELFFVLSGFVILWTAWGRSVPSVVASRVARIYPAYWAALALTSLLLLVVWRDGKQISLTEVAVNVTLLQEAFGVRHVDGVYWTLWTELRFYLIVVVLVAVGMTRRRVVALAALWPPVAVLAATVGPGWLETLLVGHYAPLFAGGMLLYLIHRDGHSGLLWSLVGLNVVLAVVGVVPAQMESLTENTIFDISPVVLGVLVVGCFAAVAAAALTPLARLDWKVLTTAGALTYPLYLVHEYWGWWTIDVLAPHLPTWATLAAACAVALGLAWVVHHGVERRVHKPVRAAVERWLTALQVHGSRDVEPGTAGARPVSPGPRASLRPDLAGASRR